MHNPPLCTLRELRDGTYSLDDLADMHEAMDEEDEYLRRGDAIARQKERD
jgi:hypothetical protein